MDGKSFIRGNLHGTGLDYWKTYKAAQQNVTLETSDHNRSKKKPHSAIYDCCHQIAMIAYASDMASSRLLEESE